MYIVTKTETQLEQQEQYNLSIPAEMTDLDGNTVIIAQLVGSFNLRDLENEKSMHLSSIASLDEKIDAIQDWIDENPAPVVEPPVEE